MINCPECKKEMELSQDVQAWKCSNTCCGYYLGKRHLYYKHTDSGYRWFTKEYLATTKSLDSDLRSNKMPRRRRSDSSLND